MGLREAKRVKKKAATIHNRKSPMAKSRPVVVVGVDLAGSPKRPTGLCVLRNLTAETHVAYSENEILDFVREAQPVLVPIDAPLSLPNGRQSVHDRSGEHLRGCDRALLRLGIRFFPITLGPMRMLTERGLALNRQLAAMGYRAVECYPGAAQDLWGIPRQHKDRLGLLNGLRKLGLRGLKKSATSDELDAATAALVGRWFLSGQGVMLGGDSGILIPAVDGPRGRSTRQKPESKTSARVILLQ
jgi:predicted nuclease with RNAse H fold